MSDDLRSAVESAFAKAEAEPAPVEPAAAPEAPAEAPAPVEAAPAAPAAEGEPVPAGERNEKGQFVAKGKTPAAKPSEAAAPKSGAPAPTEPAAPEAQAQPVTPPAPAGKPPQSWTPAAREEWSKLPATVQKEVLRREHQMQQRLSESAPEVKLAQDFKSAYAPFEAMIRAEGGEPLAAVRSLLQTAAAFRMGAPAAKAQLWLGMADQFGIPVDEAAIANLIQTRRLDIARLAAHLDGKAPQGAPAQPQQATPPLDPNALMAQIEQRFQQRLAEQARTAAQQRAASEFESFVADPANEFAEDVQDTMADLIEMAARRGKALSYQEAYQRALADPEHSHIQDILRQREAAQKATAPEQVAATRRAQVAASSVRSQPAGAAPSAAPQPTDLRAQLEAAAQQHGWR